MLDNTFLHIPGVGQKKERALWSSGITTLDDFERHFYSQISLIAAELAPESSESIFRQTKEALKNHDAVFFANRLPSREHYRIALTFPEDTIFLDIETTGLSHYYHYITLVGLASSEEFYCHIRGQSKKTILQKLAEAKCLVTFNGKIFDTKFLLKEFPDIKIPSAHVDLRFAAKSVGLTGGQKSIEAQLGINRDVQIGNVSGEQAPLLWHEYRQGNKQSGKDLVAYNHADIEGMKYILDEVVKRKLEQDNPPISIDNRYRFSENLTSYSFASSKKTAKKNRIFVPVPPKDSKPKITYSSLVKDFACRELRVVGIDLTGSEARPTGWALLDGNVAFTKQVSTDAELIVETLNAMPDLVSIDSPLSMPEGRTRVTDDDPVRDEFGIMRKCELTLKRRGVNVYPSLIPSMQRLTERGMRLADQFRRMGVPVIESYPGAAQDIMNIPRKQSGLDHLKKGLEVFGVEGDFLINDVSHDEVDAVTSAIVGIFFWTGNFEALGNEEEDYLIIPDLTSPHPNWIARNVIGVSGPIYAGKTTVGEFIKSKFNFEYTRFSLAIDQHLEKQGKKLNRESRQKFGQYIYDVLGQRWLCKQVVLPFSDDQNIIVDGLRFPEDHAFMVEKFGPAFSHIHIEASESIRKKRYMQRKQGAKDFELANNHQVEKSVKLLLGLANLKIMNESQITSLHRRIRKVIKNLSN